MLLPPSIAAALAPQYGAITELTSVSGGMINRAARVRFESETLFVKWSDSAPPGIYAAEAQGLDALRATQTFAVPSVVAQTETFLALQWLDGAPPNGAGWARTFAERLVALHRAPTEANFGWATDNFLAEFPQLNATSYNWPEFYARQRLLPHLKIARENGLMPPVREALLRRVIEQIPALCKPLEKRPSLVHGDLWAGNFMTLANGAIALFDPAVYRAPREMELAYIELFGGFPGELAPAYRELWPLPDGYERRRSLWQLYPLLMHLNTFGETYGMPLENACRAIFS